MQRRRLRRCNRNSLSTWCSRGFVTLPCREREVSAPQELSGRRDSRPPRGHRDTATYGPSICRRSFRSACRPGRKPPLRSASVRAIAFFLPYGRSPIAPSSLSNASATRAWGQRRSPSVLGCSREFTSADTAAGAQDAAVQEPGFSPEISFHTRRRPQYLQRPTPSHLSPNAPRASRWAMTTWRMAVAAA